MSLLCESSLCNSTSKQLCRDNSYYCLLFFMIGFHIQYDFLTTVLRTSKGHLPHPISITVKEHQSLQQQKKEKDFIAPRMAWGGSSLEANLC